MAVTITKDMNIRELVQKHPNSVRVFSAYGIGCIGCALASYETLEQGLNAHGININDFLNDLNGVIAE
ncbi:MAG: disulfide oxidoreductase [Spirochaetes bacterium GWF1_31_7]|nr:MAG: disulfide oxidoreductase [Spirochaetes bacterium GWE1_32_154]OHD49819.1 MAG: disulfide oxidoreductase [Spirochaetes bacterium GWF1_31_7]OHD52782.1 MAG: disulfide oxidoreductase [Spirochaetes bacterium GWE2_31_10]OHD82559.1 MAG: disulfide oxidoreductase [Spirochaetes bacterium RIFOXYB1_FULL_32_8]HBD92936.1 disulfide oxidoreductase [Spirochaetia bacterium]